MLEKSESFCVMQRIRGQGLLCPKRSRPSNAYQLYEEAGNYECITFNDTAVKTMQT